MNEQPLSQPPQSPPPSQPKRHLLVVGVCLFIVLATFTAYLFMQNQSLRQQLASLPTPTPSVAPVPTLDPTANWKTFITDDKKISLKYPSGWTADQNTTSEGWGKSITIANLKNDKFHLSVSVANAFMNECMQEISKQTITLSETTFYKRYFTGVYLYSGEACSNKENLENAEIWLQPTLIDKEPYNYQYGLLFNYKNLNKSEAETLFDQILSTFKFVEQDNAFCGGIAGTPCSSGYTCQLEGNYPDASGKCIPLR